MARVPADKREKIAKALKNARATATNDIVKNSSLSESDMALLKDGGWLFTVHGGYSFLTSEDARNGDTVHAHLAFGKFLAVYLPERLGEDYVLSPITSLEYSVRGKLPGTVVIENERMNQTVTGLAGDYCIILRKTTAIDRLSMATPKGPEGIRIIPSEEAMACLTKPEIQAYQELVCAALAGADPMALSEALVRKRNQSGGSALIGLMEGLGRETMARRIRDAMESAGFKITIGERITLAMKPKVKEPSTSYFIRSQWKSFSDAVKEKYGRSFAPIAIEELITEAQRERVQDAYHSLSIEKYTVSEDMIAAIADGEWNPEAQKDEINAMAAKGYLDAFNFVIREARRDSSLWRGGEISAEDMSEILLGLVIGIKRRLFSPMADAGLLNPSELESYRNHPVFIRGSNHVPMNSMKVAEAMQGMMTATAEEKDSYIRSVLAHFFLGFIHPFGDGNGRTSRFLMNYLRLVAGLRWIIVPVERRSEYLSGMEQMSLQNHPFPFFDFLLSLEEKFSRR